VTAPLPAILQARMQYTIRKVPQVVDAALRRRAKLERKALNQVAVEAMTEGLGLAVEGAPRRSVRDILGARTRDRSLEGALRAQRRIDAELWR
jgi:hypothetical protein